MHSSVTCSLVPDETSSTNDSSSILRKESISSSLLGLISNGLDVLGNTAEEGTCILVLHAGESEVAEADAGEVEEVDAREVEEVDAREVEEVDAREVEEVDAREVETVEEVDAREVEEVNAREVEEVDAREVEEVDAREADVDKTDLPIFLLVERDNFGFFLRGFLGDSNATIDSSHL